MSTAQSAAKTKPIFGPPRAWRNDEFVASDDRVRGGSSRSYLTPSATLTTARFHGVLDTTTLGGAGFSSQRTTTTTTTWDLSAYSGIELYTLRGDGKKYTLNIKTVLPDKMDNGRDASTVEYAYSFVAPELPTRIFIKWNEFEAYYRGKPRADAEPLDTSRILRWSIMMRSFFEEQSGPFSLTIASIAAKRDAPSRAAIGQQAEEDEDWDKCDVDEKLATSDVTISETSSGTMRFCAIL